MSVDNYTYNEDINSIDKIQFTIFGNDLVKNYSAVKKDPFGINLAESYDNFEPKKGGLVDSRLGTSDIHQTCTTCGLDSINCPGHFGHTDLAEPVFHIGFLDHVKYTLSCVCLKCSCLLIDKTEEELEQILKNKKGKSRFTEIKNLCKNISYCPRIDNNCGAPVPKIRHEIKKSTGTIKIIIESEVTALIKDEKTGIMNETKKKIREYISPKTCYDILKNISDTDCRLLGFNPELNRPEDLIIKNFPIPPVIIRPTAKIDFLASSTMEDSMTLKIADIIKANTRIRKQLDKESITGEESKYNLDNYHLLQYHVATYFDNESVALPKSEYKTGGKPSKSVSDRIKGKTGRVRSNLMGKRVDFSGRSVITSDPNIDIDEVGIPEMVARDLTFPEEVTPYNIERLTKLVKNGRDIYPGANFVFKQSTVGGSKKFIIDLKYRKNAIKLNYGDIVERHVVDGDYVLFNRQPTLHKISMMGHKIKVIPNQDINTFRVNVSVTEPYNADFDGDEMNLFVPQSIQAQTELEMIANVKKQIISPKDSNPIIGCKQDALLGAYHLTLDKTKLTGEEAMSLLMYTTSETLSGIKKDKVYTGQEVFSHIIPEGINSKKINDEGNVIFEIKNGILKKGKLDKSSLSNKKNSIIHYIWDKFGSDKTRRFIDDTQRLILNYLMLSGQTVGFGDTLVDNDTLEKIRGIIDTKLLEVNHQITEMENDSSMMNLSLFEDTMSGDLNTIGGNISKMVADQLDPNNNFALMSNSGSKGSSLNIGQIMGCLGQQIVDSKRIQKKVNNRTLAHYHQNDDTPYARGFVKSSYVDGLKAQEFFFHTMGGREGLIDTAIKTAVTGYISRKLIKGMEDIHMEYDGTVRNANGTIIQYCYGDNGVNQTVQTEIKLISLNMNNQKLKDRLTFSSSELKDISKKMNINMSKLNKFNQEYFEIVKDHRDTMRNVQMLAKRNYMVLQDKFMLPINIYRIIQDNSIESSSKKTLDPLYVYQEIQNFLEAKSTRLMCLSNSDLDNPESLKYQDEQTFKYLLKVTLYEYLAPKRCLYEYKIDKDSFDTIIQEMMKSFNKAMVEPGEMVGVIAAQSVGEPTTQMTLNTKHFAGIASKGTGNMGVPRIKELLNFSKNIKTPKMSIFLQEEYYENKSIANQIGAYLKFVSIEELITDAEIYYNPNMTSETVEGKMLEEDKVENPFYINNNKADLKSMPFVIRLVLDREKMLDKEVTLLDIKTKFILFWMNMMNDIKSVKKNERELFSKISRSAILANYDTSTQPVAHIRFNMTSYNYESLIEFFNIVLDRIKLKGIEGVDNVEMSNERLMKFNKDDGDISVIKHNVIYTDGINMKDIRYIKGINLNKTSTNDIATIYYMFGIEAARAALMNEFNTTYENGGTSVNHHHLSILVDVMTHVGAITSIDRHGINRLDTDPLARASFEKTIEQLILAGIFNEVDHMRSVSSRIMAGKVIKGGTGLCQIMLDTDLLENTEYVEDEDIVKTFTELTQNVYIKDILNRLEDNGDYYIPSN